LCLLDAPQGKVAKNRLHMDVRVGGWEAVTRTVALQRGAGGTVVAGFAGHHVVMADPERNEFCVA
jgi:hypothetical protein